MNKKVIIVDDEHSIRFTIQKFLEKDGFIVESAEDAEKALEIISKSCFDLVITDILLPKINGIELLHKIQQICPLVKVIMITGEPNVSTAAEALRLGACDYLFKPVDKNSLLKSVRNAIRIKELEDENRKYQSDLEALVKERTKRMEHAIDKMKSMQEDLLHNERLKGFDLISSGIAHDINNSLSPIMIYSEALLERLNGKDLHSIEYVEKIIKAAEQIEMSIKKIDEFHLNSRKEKTDEGRGDLKSLLDTVSECFSNDCRVVQKKLRIINDYEELDGTQLSVKCNEFSDILKELLTNAVEASEPKKEIKICCSQNGIFADISVSDEGCGMTEDQLDHCCDPYYTTKGPKFNGLGLSKVYGLVCRNQGNIEIKSTPGEGTNVSLSFPIIK